jgi:hypothetical protein
MTAVLLASIATVLVLGLALCFLLQPKPAVATRAMPRPSSPPIARVAVARARAVPVAKPEIIDAEFVVVCEPAVCGVAPRLLLPPNSPARAAVSRSLVVPARADAPSRALVPVVIRQPNPYHRSAPAELGRIIDVSA